MKGFTLIELLIVIGIIAILAAGIIIAINPGAQFATTRDVVRESHTRTIHQGIVSYIVDQEGMVDFIQTPGELVEICNTNIEEDCNGLADLSVLVSGGFISQIPIDPRGGVDDKGIGYFVFQDVSSGNIGVVSNKSETRKISIGPPIPFTCGDEITFTYREGNVTYGTVDGENETCWMDRNLGAERVAEKYDDDQSYGHLFQWGRLDDGHQLRNSSITHILSSNTSPEHSNFITNVSGSTNDNWYNGSDPNDLWQEDGTGINNPCPEGWRVPTIEELESEMDSWANTGDRRIDAFNSNLKWPTTGFRAYDDGLVVQEGSQGGYWSSSVEESDRSWMIGFIDSTDTITGNTVRIIGYSVRCIKN